MESDSTPREKLPSGPADELRETLPKKAVDHIANPRNVGEFRTPDGVGRASIPCGDSMQICLRVTNGRILEARFMTDGCGQVIACGSMATELVKGRTISEAMAVSEDDIMSGLDGLPEPETYCAVLAVNALKQALMDYLALRREPWKRTYRQIEPFEPGR
jgi:nitrogen fixation protein NifU and related proteins